MQRWFSFAVFISIVLTVFGGVHYYLYSRINSWIVGDWILGLAFVALSLAPVAARMSERISRFLYIPLWWVAACWMGIAFYLLTFLTLGHLVESAMMVAGAWPGASAHRFTVGIPFMLTIAASAVGLVLGDRKPCVTEIDIDLANLPKEADGVTLIHISDVHVGSLVGERKVRRLVAQLNALQPDIVVITGDLVDERPSNLGASLNALTELRPRIGTYAVTGNHEFYAGIAASVAWMKRAGIVVLSNEVVEPIEGLLLAGFHDPTGIRWDDARFRSPSEEMTRVLSARDGDKPTVVLYHQPVWIEQFAKLGVSLLLCGHTHGGQLWPFRYLTALRYRHTQGLYEEGDLRVYVCRGTATWGPPMRLPQPAEIVRFHLRSAS